MPADDVPALPQALAGHQRFQALADEFVDLTIARTRASDAKERDFKQFLNPRSLEILTAKVEPSLAEATPEARYQLERLAYFCEDGKASRPGHPIFNRTITLKDTWAKEAQKR